MSGKNPCYQCEKRTAICHSKCKDYLDWKSDKSKKQAEINKKRDISRQLDDTNFQRIRKMQERRR